MKDGDCRIWMPLYIGDYMADTIHFSHADHGAYVLLLMAYWRKQGPLTNEEFRRVAGREFGVVSEYFSRVDGHWYHVRLQKELEKACEKMRSIKERSMKGVAARQEKQK